MDDGQAEELSYRHMDFDCKTNSQCLNPANPETELPDSLYLAEKAAFFGDLR
jgi:hypothetical protein